MEKIVTVDALDVFRIREFSAEYVIAADAFVAAVNRGDSDDEQARLYAIANREYEKATNRLREEE